MRRILFLASLCLAGLCASCQKASDKLVRVEGIVRLEGQPVPNLIVQFLPDAFLGTNGPRSTATTDAEGKFVLVCDSNKEGAVPGKHRVVLEDPERKPPPQGSDSPPPMGRVHFFYQEAKTTPLLVEVPAAGGFVDVELVRKPVVGTPPKSTKDAAD